MPLPGVEIIDHQGIVVAAVMRDDRLRPLADDVQLLIGPQPEPGAGERKPRPRDRLQAKDIAVKSHAPLDIGNVDGDVIELD
jgi:hypothetical protein